MEDVYKMEITLAEETYKQKAQVAAGPANQNRRALIALHTANNTASHSAERLGWACAIAARKHAESTAERAALYEQALNAYWNALDHARFAATALALANECKS